MKAGEFRGLFSIPERVVYLDNNSLGLCGTGARGAVVRELDSWSTRAIGGWTDEGVEWITLAERVGAKVAGLVGAAPRDVVATGSTTSNLHQLMATLWDGRGRVLIDRSAFPSDRYAVESQLRLRGLDPRECLREVDAEPDGFLDEGRIAEMFPGVSLAVLPSVVYTSGQLLDMEFLTRSARSAGTLLIWDCAHSVGIVPHRFAEWGVDAAFWCHYKWCNGGPGSVAGLYVHPRFGDQLPGLAGWWGGRKETLFLPDGGLVPADGAGRLQAGTPSVLSLAAVDGALDLLVDVGIGALRECSLSLTKVLLDGLGGILGEVGGRVSTPQEDHRRGGHVAVRVAGAGAKSAALRSHGIVPDHRRPDWIRLAPSPLVNTEDELRGVLGVVEDVFRSGMDSGDDSVLVP